YAALRDDPGLRAVLESSIYGESVTDAAIVDTNGVAIAHNDRTQEGKPFPDRSDLAALLEEGALEQLKVIYSQDGGTLEVRQPMILEDQAFGTIRIGVSTL